ncbi:MAG: FitA-like ribbon-helix-helix domain-containing protein [Rhodoferax sp.]
MPHLSIKDVPEAWVEALRQRAQANHRSLQGELMAMVESVVQQSATGGAQPVAAVAPSALSTESKGSKSIEVLLDELRAQHPQPIWGQLSSIELIRQERDQR